jgi:hypothetical protein
LKVSTYSSNLISNVRLPTYKKVEANFFYNFFTKDEALIEGVQPSESRAVEEKDILRRSSRYVRLNFLPPIDSSISKKSTSIVKENIEKIYSIEDIGNSSYTTVAIQDTAASDRIFQTIMRSANLRSVDGNMTDISLELGNQLGSIIDRNLLQELSVSYAERGAQFISDRKILKAGKFEDVKSLPVSMTINDKFLLDILTVPGACSFSGPIVSLGLLSDSARSIQERARSSTPSIGSSDFITYLEPVELEASTVGEFVSGIERIAGLIYRSELLPDGRQDVRLIDVIDPNASTYIDFKIKLDSQYSYWLHSVYLVQVNVLSGDTGQVLRASVLFQSNVSTSSTVYCRDEIPPEPPVDFDARWDYQDYSLVLSWNFPVNPRRDIKYFQVFRRDSLERPFELLMEYDFNDSFKQPSRLENTYEHLVKKFESPFNIYIDKDFNKDAKYYYAIACVDARGMVSNYSQQFEITFDRIKNKLMKRMVSPSGAPRQYPNVFLKDNFFQDSIISSKKRRIKLYFDPEYLKIKTNNDTLVDALITTEGGEYGINLLDITRGQILTIPVKINNLLETSES